MRRAVLAVALLASLLGCTAAPGLPAPSSPAESTVASGSATPSARSTPAPTTSPSPRPARRPVRFDARRVQRDIAHLAVEIGPREAASRRYARAATWVQRRFEALGYEVRRTTVAVPAGTCWG